MKRIFILVLALAWARMANSQMLLKSIDDLANSSVLILQPTIKDSADTGTGTLISFKDKYFILTASHVIKKCDLREKIVIHLPGDKPLMIDLITITKGNTHWQVHPIADLAIIQVYPNHFTGFDTLLTKYSFTADLMYFGNQVGRDVELTFFGYPVIEPTLVHFSALSFHGTVASGLITLNRADTNTPCDFVLMNIPSMQGCSGSGVFFNIAKPIITTGSDKTLMIGLVHGTKSDDTGGKIALITPLSYMNDWNIDMK